jgi:uncharacterized protein YecT (DUF1311 family)
MLRRVSWAGAFTAALLCAAPAAAQTQMELNVQAAAGYRAADLELNQTYKQVLAHLSSEARPLLRASQRAWIVFRDEECAFRTSGAAGGSIYPMIKQNCLEELTRVRAQELRNFLNCPDGDLSCSR